MAESKNETIEEESHGFVSYGSLVLPPVVPNSEFTALCHLLDDFYKNYPTPHKNRKASDLIEGAFYAIRRECRSNPDWMSQSANSARDVLYPLLRSQAKTNSLIKLFTEFANSTNSLINNKEFVHTFSKLDHIYRKLSDLTHHGVDLKGFNELEFRNFSDSDYLKLLEEFSLVLKQVRFLLSEFRVFLCCLKFPLVYCISLYLG